MHCTQSAERNTRRQRYREKVRQTSRFNVISDTGETLAARLPLLEAQDFRDRWNSEKPGRISSIVLSPANRPHTTPDPTEVDIATLSAEIRGGWSRTEERKRRSWSVTPWHVPHCLDR